MAPEPAYAHGDQAYEERVYAQEEILRGTGEVIAGLDLPGDDISIDMRWLGGEGEAGIAEALETISAGGVVSPQAILEAALNGFAQGLLACGKLMVSIMTPVLLVCMCMHLTGGGEAGLSRPVCTMLTLIPLLLLSIRELDHTRATILDMTGKMENMLPVLLTLLTALGGNASSAFLHPVVVTASGSMVFLTREVILRLVMCTCAVTAVNHLSDRAHLTRMAQLLRSAVCWLLGVSFTVFLGAMSLQGVCSASIDGIMLRAAKYAVDNFVPVVGGMFSDTMDTLVGCTLIVKNALGVTCVLVLCGALMGPLMGTLSSVFALKLCAALLEPVAGGEVIGAISDFTRILVLFLITMLCVGTMYFLLIVQMLLVGNLTVMLR